VHSRISFYVYAKIGQVNGAPAPRPLNPPLVRGRHIEKIVKNYVV